MILKIESDSGLWNPQQLKQLSNLMDNSSYVLKFLSDKTVALVVDDSDGETYTKELTKMGFKVHQDTESVDSLISGSSTKEEEKPLTDSEENMNMNIKEDSNKTQENIPDIHINAHDKLEAKEDVMIKDTDKASQNPDIKISEDNQNNEDKQPSIDQDNLHEEKEEEMKDQDQNLNSQEVVEETKEVQEDKVEEIKEEIQEQQEDEVLEDSSSHEEVEEPKQEQDSSSEDAKEEEKVEEKVEDKVEEHKSEEETKLEEEAVLDGFEETEKEAGLDEVEPQEEPKQEEVKDDTEVHIDKEYEEKPEIHEELKEEQIDEHQEPKLEEQQDLDIENTYKDSDEDLISDVEDFIMEEDNKKTGKILDINHLASSQEEVSGLYGDESKDIETIGIETYAGNLNLSFGSGISITLALMDCKDGIKTFNINGKSVYIECMDGYCLISYDNMQIRVPTTSMKKVG